MMVPSYCKKDIYQYVTLPSFPCLLSLSLSLSQSQNYIIFFFSLLEPQLSEPSFIISCSAYEQPAERRGASPSVPLSDKFAMNLPIRVPQIPPLALAAASHKVSLVALLEADSYSSEVTHTTTFQVINLFRYPSAATHPWPPMLTIFRSQEPCEYG